MTPPEASLTVTRTAPVEAFCASRALAETATGRTDQIKRRVFRDFFRETDPVSRCLRSIRRTPFALRLPRRISRNEKLLSSLGAALAGDKYKLARNGYRGYMDMERQGMPLPPAFDTLSPK